MKRHIYRNFRPNRPIIELILTKVFIKNYDFDRKISFLDVQNDFWPITK